MVSQQMTFLCSYCFVILSHVVFCKYQFLALAFQITHFYRIREEGGSGRPPPPPPVHLRTDDVT